MDASVRSEILRRLAAAEAEHGVRILFACESGSRAWGFPSPDSDYDVRFIYVRSVDSYLSFDIESHRDVIEYPIVDEIDCNGWDLRKALHLITRTNGALLEWIHSPIVYMSQGALGDELRAIAPQVLNPIALCYHYSHMARGNAREYLSGGRVRLKKYFYVLRPLLAIRYVRAGLGIPPVEFHRLLETVAPKEIVPVVESLVALKRSTPELGSGEPIPELDSFIASELSAVEEFSGVGRPEHPVGGSVRDQLNEIFRRAVRGSGL